MKAGHLSISEERVGPPDAAQHLVADAEFIFVAGPGEVKPRVVPVLTEIEVHCEVLHHPVLLSIHYYYYYYYYYYHHQTDKLNVP